MPLRTDYHLNWTCQGVSHPMGWLLTSGDDRVHQCCLPPPPPPHPVLWVCFTMWACLGFFPPLCHTPQAPTPICWSQFQKQTIYPHASVTALSSDGTSRPRMERTWVQTQKKCYIDFTYYQFSVCPLSRGKTLDFSSLHGCPLITSFPGLCYGHYMVSRKWEIELKVPSSTGQRLGNSLLSLGVQRLTWDHPILRDLGWFML